MNARPFAFAFALLFLSLALSTAFAQQFIEAPQYSSNGQARTAVAAI
jgi:hypothetical protein